MSATAGARDRLIARPRFGAGLGLHRMAAVLADMEPARWQQNGRALHVVGTKGKGTVATLAAAVLRALGLRVGLFVSPHLQDFGERISIDGAAITAPALEAATRRFETFESGYRARHPGDDFGAFEAITATAFHAFGAADVDVAVFEAGIGGRYDATRAANGATVALTSVGLDHATLLGPTRTHILYDKADLCPSGGALIAGPLEPDLARRLAAFAHLKGFGLHALADETVLSGVRHGLSGSSADLLIRGQMIADLKTRLHGSVQLANAALALVLVRHWLDREGLNIDAPAFAQAARAALSATHLPLRFETIADAPLVIADIAHTAESAAALAETLRAVLPSRRYVLLVGIAEDKDRAGILAPLLPQADAVVACAAGPRRASPETVGAAARSLATAPIEAIAAPEAAYARARDLARRGPGLVLVTGSSPFAAVIKTIAAGNDPAALTFL